MSSIDELATGLGSNDTAVRIHSAERLAHRGREAAPAAVALIRNVADHNESVAEWSCAALETLGPPPASLLEELIDLAGSKNVDEAYWAVTLIGRLDVEGAAAVPTLVQLMQATEHEVVRHRSTWALGRIGPTAESARPVLETATTAPDPRLADLARIALDRIAG